MLLVEDLHAGYGTSEVLTGLSLEVRAGTVVALIGANGAGKTTTMRAVSGALRPSRGRVVLDGRDVQGLDASRIARLGLAHAPEGRKVFGPLSVEDNLLLGAYARLPRFFGFRRRAKSDLDRQTALTTGLAITSDVLGVASVVAVGVSTYLTIKYERGKRLKLGMSARGVQVGGTF